MKNNLRLVVLFVVAAVILLLFNMFRQATAPQSTIIAKQREKLAASQDKSRMEKDPVYALEFQSKLQFLDYQLALAYNKENEPDEAIKILQKLISDEETKNKGGIPRRSRSYLDEALYYEALQQSYSLKHDEAGAERAMEHGKKFMAKAEEAKRKARMEEGICGS